MSHHRRYPNRRTPEPQYPTLKWEPISFDPGELDLSRPLPGLVDAGEIQFTLGYPPSPATLSIAGETYRGTFQMNHHGTGGTLTLAVPTGG